MTSRNKDFYDYLPGVVCETLERLIAKYGDRPWFDKAWEEYRDHVKSSSLDDMRMPGYVFKHYIEEEK